MLHHHEKDHTTLLNVHFTHTLRLRPIIKYNNAKCVK